MAEGRRTGSAELRGSDPDAGEPFFFAGGSIGCVLLHGFTAAPREMRPMGEFLNERGITVYGARLAGHGTCPEDLARTAWRDWYTSALGAVQRLRERCRAVFACGLSLGGALSLLLAAHKEVDGAIAINTPLRPHDKRLKYARFLAPFKPYTPKGLANLHDPTALADHADYLRIPTRAAAELHRLTRVLERALPRVDAPVLVIKSRLDRVVPPDDGQTIFDRIAASDKRLVWLARGGHIATEDYDKEIVFEEALHFIEAHTPAKRAVQLQISNFKLQTPNSQL
ncbi:MAG TPA: alpha/beta fold hydrolase [Anaerolineae bacterium]|nr:alpha/beta fold hydrolase [Anaerolineae bacterium]